MYPTASQLADFAAQHQQALLSEAAQARLIRHARRAPTFPSPASRSLRSRLATSLRALAAWIDDRAHGETPLVQPA